MEYIGDLAYRPDIVSKTTNLSESYYTSPTDKTYDRDEVLDEEGNKTYKLNVKSFAFYQYVNRANYGDGAMFF